MVDKYVWHLSSDYLAKAFDKVTGGGSKSFRRIHEKFLEERSKKKTSNQLKKYDTVDKSRRKK